MAMTFRERAVDAAMKLLQNENVQRAMNDERVQNAISSAVQRGGQLRSELGTLKKRVAAEFDLATEDDLREMKAELDRLRSSMSATAPDVTSES